jgi:hypothetical protein
MRKKTEWRQDVYSNPATAAAQHELDAQRTVQLQQRHDQLALLRAQRNRARKELDASLEQLTGRPVKTKYSRY